MGTWRKKDVSRIKDNLERDPIHVLYTHGRDQKA